MPRFNILDFLNGSGGSTGGGSTGGGSTGGSTGTAAGLVAAVWLAGLGAPSFAVEGSDEVYTDSVTGRKVTLEDGAAYLDLGTGTPWQWDDANGEWDQLQAFGGGGLLYADENPTALDGYDGARWINLATGAIFERTAGVWNPTGDSLRGPMGATGPANGREFRSFAGVPDDAQGKAGDTGLNRATAELYTHDGSVWTATGQTIIGAQGPAGDDAYQVWLDDGNIGTRADFLATLKGDPGSPGGFSMRSGNGAPNDATGLIGDGYIDRDNRGLVYVKVDDGQGGAGTWIETADYIGSNQMIPGNGQPTAEIGLVGDLYFDIDNNSRLYQKVTATAWVDLQRGLGGAGASAYEVAVQEGFEGSPTAWLDSLRGQSGKSAYELAQDAGYTGTEGEWLDTLGGASAYQIAVEGGYVGTETDWLDSLIGAPGESAYDAHVRIVTAAGGTPQPTAEAWLLSLKGTKGDPGAPGTDGNSGVIYFPLRDGVDTTGSTDMSWPLLQAFQAAQAEGKKIDLGSGTYRVSFQILLADFENVECFASGDATIVSDTETGNVFELLRCKRMIFRGFTMDCRGATRVGLYEGGGIAIGADCVDCHILNMKGWAGTNWLFMARSAIRPKINGCVIYGAATAANDDHTLGAPAIWITGSTVDPQATMNKGEGVQVLVGVQTIQPNEAIRNTKINFNTATGCFAYGLMEYNNEEAGSLQGRSITGTRFIGNIVEGTTGSAFIAGSPNNYIYGSGIYSQGGSDTLISGNLVSGSHAENIANANDGNAPGGIGITNGSRYRVIDNDVIGGYIGISVRNPNAANYDQTDLTLVALNRCRDGARDGIEVLSAARVGVKSNVISGWGRNGIFVQALAGSKLFSVNDNDVIDCAGSNIVLDKLAKFVCNDNLTKGGLSGIGVFDCVDGTIAGNVMDDPVNRGIDLSAGSSGVLIDANQITGAGQMGMLLNGKHRLGDNELRDNAVDYAGTYAPYAPDDGTALCEAGGRSDITLIESGTALDILQDRRERDVTVLHGPASGTRRINHFAGTSGDRFRLQGAANVDLAPGDFVMVRRMSNEMHYEIARSVA